MRALAALAVPLATVSVELIAVVAAFALFAVFLLCVGAAPLAVFGDMAQGAFGSRFSVENSLSRAAPLMLTALCTSLPARLGMCVIGNEGALLLGGLAAAATAMVMSGALPPGVLLPLMLIAGAAVGGAWIALAGWLRQSRGVNETISSLLLFYVGLGLFLYLVEGPLRDPSSLNKPSTYPVGDANMLGNVPGMDVHLGLVFGVVACLVTHVLMEYTTFGFSARIVGGNVRAAQVAGLRITRLTLITCLLAGAAAGLAGSIEVVAIHGSANATLYAGLGFAGVLVAFVARQNSLAIVIVAIAMGGIEASGGVLQRRHDLPDAAVDVFKGCLFLVVLASESLVTRAQTYAQRFIAPRREPELPAVPVASTTPGAPA
jgi:general nucleoside transport system permease protein